MKIQPAHRLNDFPVYLFDKLDKQKREVEANGIDVINLGVGDPDEGTPGFITDELKNYIEDTELHHYPSYKGLDIFRKAVADWYNTRFGVKLNPEDEVLSLIGSKAGIGLLPLSLVNPGEYVILPDPCYTAYRPGIIISDAKIYDIPLYEKNNYLPDLAAIPEDVAKKAKLILLNYPNNPTGAVAPIEFFKELIQWAKKYEVLVAHDAPYSEMTREDIIQPSILAVPGAKDIAVEFHSFSKLFNMTGWRIAYIVGNADIIGAFGKLRSNIDMGIFQPLQYAAVHALNNGREFIQKMRKLYNERRSAVCNALNEIGWNVKPTPGTFFLWMAVPTGELSIPFASEVLQKTGVLLTPGKGFGDHGEGYLRLALTHPVPRLLEAVQRLKDAGYIYNK